MNTNKFSPRLLMALLCTGVIAGIVGIVFTHLLHVIQQLVFHGNFPQTAIPFRELAEQTPPAHRLFALVGCGLVVGCGWVALHRYAKPMMDIKVAVNQPEKDMPICTMICHSTLQIVTVAMGSPLGREVAPREMSVALSTPLSHALHLSLKQKQILLACASGAGLAAVYNAPLASTVFILETLLLAWDRTLLACALFTCVVAVVVARVGLGDMVQYGNILPLLDTDLSIATLIWAVFAGIVLAFGVRAFSWCNERLPKFKKSSWLMIPVAIGAFTLIGLMSMKLPEILGNGKAGNQLSFADNLTWQYALGLLLTKWGAMLLATIAGAYGGHITPSIMLGGLIAFLTAIVWNCFLPGVPVGLSAFIGATVFLGIAQNMRLTAIVFMLELSRLSTADWLPMCLCMAVALLVHSTLVSPKTPSQSPADEA